MRCCEAAEFCVPSSERRSDVKQGAAVCPPVLTPPPVIGDFHPTQKPRTVVVHAAALVPLWRETLKLSSKWTGIPRAESPCTHTHRHTPAFGHAHTHTLTHTHTHTHTHERPHTYTHTDTLTRTHTCTHTLLDGGRLKKGFMFLGLFLWLE